MKNILLITTDQHRADCLSSAGHPVVATPHLDQLAAEGVRFSAAYSDCPICIPARCSIISGLHASTFGKPYYFEHEPFPITRSETLMSLMTQAGYQTQAVGKMHFYPERARYGFENMILDWDYVDWLNEQTDHSRLAFVGNGVGLNEFWPTAAPVPSMLTSTAWTVNESIRFLHRRDPERPFFLWVSFFDPHPPLMPPEPYYSMYDDYPIPEPAMGDWTEDAPYDQRFHRESHKYDKIVPQTIRKIRSAYYGQITYIDHQLGRLLGAMRSMGILDETLIVYTSDHGEMLGDHRDFGKSTLYEASAKVPMIVRFPKGHHPERRGEVCDAPVGLVDVLPTLTEFAGIETPEGIDGRDMLSLGEEANAAWRSYYPCEVKARGGMFALTNGTEKYMWFQWGNREQYFRLDEDPLETNDLSRNSTYADRMAWWRECLVERLTKHNHPAVRNGRMVSMNEPYPPERMVRAANPLGWNFDRPNN